MYTKNLIHLLLHFVCFLTLKSVKSQSQEYVPPSPNAASLGEYGRVPVSLFNGLANVNIPLGSISEDGVTIPISLGYHGGGIKQHNFPSWVGLGWDLQSGGVITRKTNGAVDELLDMTVGNNASYYYNYNMASVTNWYSYEKMYEYFYPETPAQMPKVNFAPQPDEFIFNFGGYSGSFFYDHTGKWQVRSKEPVHIQIKETLKTDYILEPANQQSNKAYTLPRIFYQFILITPDGTSYTFGGTPNSIEFNRPISHAIDPRFSITATSWYLTKVITKNGKEILLDYERDGINAQAAPSYYTYSAGVNGQAVVASSSTILNVSIINPCYLRSINTEDQAVYFLRSATNQLPYKFDEGYTNILRPLGIRDGNDQEIISQDMLYTHTVMSQMGYSDIIWPANGSVPIYTGTKPHPTLTGLYFKWVKLDQIRFFTKTGINPSNLSDDLKMLKQFDFQYTDEPTSRLILDSLTEVSGEGTTIKPSYSFSYYNRQAIPSYYPDRTDHWGYYNGGIEVPDFKNKQTKSFTLKPASAHTFSFTTGQTGDVVISLPGYLGEDWAVTYDFADNAYNGALLSMRSRLPVNGHWTTYSNNEAYVLTKTFRNVPPGTYYLRVYSDSRNATPGSSTDQLYIDYNGESSSGSGTITGNGIEDFLGTAYKGIDSELMKAGVLTSIKYPTGGKTDFEYEPHDYEKIAKRYPFEVQDVVRSKAGGLRIRKVSDYDPVGDITQSKEYFYVANYSLSTPGSSSGILSGVPEYTEKGDVNSGGNNYWYVKTSSQPLIPLSKTNGNDITYSEVVEKLADGSYTIFNYSNHDNPKYRDRSVLDGVSQVIGSMILEPNINMELDRGKLLKERIFNNQGTILKSNEFIYDEAPAREQEAVRVVNVSIKEFASTYKPIGAPTSIAINLPSVRLSSSLFFTFPQYLLKKNETSYQQNGTNSLVTTTEYTYNKQYRQPAMKSTINSKQQVVSASYLYPYDINKSHNDFTVYGEMVAKNMINPVVETREKVGGIPTKITKVNYNKFTENNLYLPESIQIQEGTGPLEKALTYHRYDIHGNVLEQESKSTFETYLWGYKSKYPYAKITGDRGVYSEMEWFYDEIGLDMIKMSRAATYPDWQIREETDKIRNFFYDAQVQTYTYAPGIGMTSATDPKGYTITYEYDGFGRLSYIRDHANKLLKKYTYNYSKQSSVEPNWSYFNLAQGKTFIKQGCPIDFVGTPVQYSVKRAVYTSSISQADADIMAKEEIDANGQNNANANGLCVPVNCETITILLYAGNYSNKPTDVTFSSLDGLVTKYYSFPSSGGSTPTMVILPYKSSGYVLKFSSSKQPPNYENSSAVTFSYTLIPGGRKWNIVDGGSMNRSRYVETEPIMFTTSCDKVYVIMAEY